MNRAFWPRTATSQMQHEAGIPFNPGANGIPFNGYHPYFGNVTVPNQHMFQPPQPRPVPPEMMLQEYYRQWARQLQQPILHSMFTGQMNQGFPHQQMLPPMPPPLAPGMPPLEVIRSIPPPRTPMNTTRPAPLGHHIHNQPTTQTQQQHGGPLIRQPTTVPVVPEQANEQRPIQVPVQPSNSERSTQDEIPRPIDKYRLTELPEWCKAEIERYKQEQERQKNMQGEISLVVNSPDVREGQHQFMTPPMETTPTEHPSNPQNEDNAPHTAGTLPVENSTPAPEIQPFFHPANKEMLNVAPPPQEPPTLTPAVTPSPTNSPTQRAVPLEVNSSTANSHCQMEQEDSSPLRDLLEQPPTPEVLTSSTEQPLIGNGSNPTEVLEKTPTTVPPTPSCVPTSVATTVPLSDPSPLLTKRRSDGLIDPRRRTVEAKKENAQEQENKAKEMKTNVEPAKQITWQDLFGDDPPGRRNRKRRSTEERKDKKRAGRDSVVSPEDPVTPTSMSSPFNFSGGIITGQFTGTFTGIFTGNFIPVNPIHQDVLVLKSGEGDDTETIPAVLADQNVTEEDVKENDRIAKPKDKQMKQYCSRASQTMKKEKKEIPDSDFPAASHVCSGADCEICDQMDLQEILRISSL